MSRNIALISLLIVLAYSTRAPESFLQSGQESGQEEHGTTIIESNIKTSCEEEVTETANKCKEEGYAAGADIAACIVLSLPDYPPEFQCAGDVPFETSADEYFYFEMDNVNYLCTSELN